VRDVVNAGTLRDDLLYRINPLEVRLSPLDARPSDIPLLLNWFIEEPFAEPQRRGGVAGADRGARDGNGGC